MKTRVCLPSQLMSCPLERDSPTHLVEEDLHAPGVPPRCTLHRQTYSAKISVKKKKEKLPNVK